MRISEGKISCARHRSVSSLPLLKDRERALKR